MGDVKNRTFAADGAADALAARRLGEAGKSGWGSGPLLCACWVGGGGLELLLGESRLEALIVIQTTFYQNSKHEKVIVSTQ